MGELFSQIVEKCRSWADQSFAKGTLQIELNQKGSNIVQNKEFLERYGYIYIYIYIYILISVFISLTAQKVLITYVIIFSEFLKGQ